MAKPTTRFRLPKHLSLVVIVICCLSLTYGIMHETRRPYDDLRMSAEMNSLFETDNRDTSEDRQSRDYSEYQQYHEIDNLGDYQRDGRGETQLIKESNEGGVRWKGWNYLDTSQDDDSSNRLQSHNEGWTPHDKTISLQFLDDDGRFAHSPPTWPHDEYFLQYPRPLIPTKTNSSSVDTFHPVNEPSQQTEDEKEYEWQRLRPRPLTNSAFIGPGFYDYSAGNTHRGPTHQAITDGSSSSSASASAGGDGDVQVPNSVSESASSGKFYPGYPGYGYGGYRPQDYYKRKRLRLKIHPGLLAAPIAGFAAYKAVSAIASKPLLFELGWVNNKPDEIGGGGWGWSSPQHHHPSYPPTQIVPYPDPYPVHVPVPVVPINPRPIGGPVPQYPVLRPTKNQDKKSSSSGWWNPFSGLTPRFRMRSRERKCCGS